MGLTKASEGVMVTQFIGVADQNDEEAEKQAERFEDVSENATDPVMQEFDGAALRIVVQRNDFLLPTLIDMIKTHKTIEVAPAYQRRLRWDRARKSKLIESFLVNIPVPPVFLYESEFARYEVMDGQQRINTLVEFFDNQFALTAMEILTSLNTLRYHQLPSTVRASLDRRYLSTIILLKESTPSPRAAELLRQKVFERLNTGGVKLNAQEVRNCIYAGTFNNLLLELSRNQLFTQCWDIPPREVNEDNNPSRKLATNPLFSRMGDVELVLRVFALLDSDNLGKGMKSTLDNTMQRNAHLRAEQVASLRSKFLDALELAFAIGGSDVFRVPSKKSKKGRPSASLYDGMMVALMRSAGRKNLIKAAADKIWRELQVELENPEFRTIIVGQPNTKTATVQRSKHIEALIARVLAGGGS
jgi:hypothetical protein